MKRSNITSAFIRGAEAVPVDVEVAIERGLPAFNIVGMVDAAVLEAREHVRCAIIAAGFSFPTDGKILVNLSPASIKKRGASFDLAIALGILAATGQVDPKVCKDLAFGELSLDGGVQPFERGFALYAKLALECGMPIICASRQGQLCADYGDIRFNCIDNLSDLRDGSLKPLNVVESQPLVPTSGFDCVEGYAGIKSALLEAVQNNENLLILTKPDKNIDKLISCVPSLLPKMSNEALMEVEGIYSACREPYYGNRPFRAPHHSVTPVGLLGGGNPIYPGEVSLAHNGVLYLAGLEYINLKTLRMLCRAVNEGCVHIARADGAVEIPSNTLVIATAKPCPCGNFGNPDEHEQCRCGAGFIARYQERLIGAGGGLFAKVVR